MKNLKTFKQLKEAKIVQNDTSKTNFNTGSLIQIVDEEDKNIGQAEIKKVLKQYYTVTYKGKQYKTKKEDLVLNIHGQVQTELKNLK